MRRLAITALVLGLLVGTTAAFALTEALKLEHSPLARVRFAHFVAPTCGCRRATARLAFRLRRSDTLDAVMIDDDGDPVRTLVDDSRRDAGRIVLRWDGRDNEGNVVPDGAYQLRIHLADDHRTIVVPDRVHVDTEPPAVELVSLAPRRLSPDGDGERDAAAIVFHLSERARPLVLVDGSVALVGKRTGSGSAELVWPGTDDERPLPEGTYLVSLEARDAAGNISTATEAVPVRIRYIELAASTLRSRRGAFLRFRVLTDAGRFEWKLFRRGGLGRPLAFGGPSEPGRVVLALPPHIRTGRYVLRVSANGHHDDAVVIVRARS